MVGLSAGAVQDSLANFLSHKKKERVLNIQLGERSRLAWLGVDVDRSSPKWFISKNAVVSGLGLLGVKQRNVLVNYGQYQGWRWGICNPQDVERGLSGRRWLRSLINVITIRPQFCCSRGIQQACQRFKQEHVGGVGAVIDGISGRGLLNDKYKETDFSFLLL